jgi:hypothetical protein
MPNAPRFLKKELKEKLKKETLKDFDPRLKVFNENNFDENKVRELVNKDFGSYENRKFGRYNKKVGGAINGSKLRRQASSTGLRTSKKHK